MPKTRMPFSIRAAYNDDIPAIRAVLDFVRPEYGVLAVGAATPTWTTWISITSEADAQDRENATHRIVGCAACVR